MCSIRNTMLMKTARAIYSTCGFNLIIENLPDYVL